MLLSNITHFVSAGFLEVRDSELDNYGRILSSIVSILSTLTLSSNFLICMWPKQDSLWAMRNSPSSHLSSKDFSSWLGSLSSQINRNMMFAILFLLLQSIDCGASSSTIVNCMSDFVREFSEEGFYIEIQNKFSKLETTSLPLNYTHFILGNPILISGLNC